MRGQTDLPTLPRHPLVSNEVEHTTTIRMIHPTSTIPVSAFFQALGAAPRLEILLAIGASEACVCHLEAALGYRQVFISQHLMALREASLLESRRDGRFVYYRLADLRVLDVLVQAGEIVGRPVAPLPAPIASCACPNCAAATSRRPKTEGTA